MTRLIDPSVKSKGINDCNKWYKYASRKRSPPYPRQTTIQMVLKKVPESKNTLESPLWKLLELTSHQQISEEGVIKQLSVEIQTCIQSAVNKQGYKHLVDCIHPSTLYKIMLFANFDALALLILLLSAAKRDKDKYISLIHHVLLILACKHDNQYELEGYLDLFDLIRAKVLIPEYSGCGNKLIDKGDFYMQVKMISRILDKRGAQIKNYSKECIKIFGANAWMSSQIIFSCVKPDGVFLNSIMRIEREIRRRRI